MEELVCCIVEVVAEGVLAAVGVVELVAVVEIGMVDTEGVLTLGLRGGDGLAVTEVRTVARLEDALHHGSSSWRGWHMEVDLQRLRGGLLYA